MGRFGNNKRRVAGKDGVEYESIAVAAKSSGTPQSTICSHLRRLAGSWTYVLDPVLEDEIFIDHVFLRDISISNHGRVRRQNGVITRGSLRKDGYRYFHHHRSKKNYTVHRLVAESWMLDCGEVVHHMNERKDDNRLENLEWCSQRENVQKSINK